MPQPNQTYRCVTCGETFTSRDLLNRHAKEQHEQKTQTGRSASSSDSSTDSERGGSSSAGSSLSEE